MEYWNYDEILSKIQDKFVVISGERGTGKSLTMLKLAQDLANRLDIPFSIEKNFHIGSRTLLLQDTKLKVCFNLTDLSLEEIRKLDYHVRVSHVDKERKRIYIGVEAKVFMSYSPVSDLDIPFPSPQIMIDYNNLKLAFMKDPFSFMPNMSMLERERKSDVSKLSTKMTSISLQGEYLNKLIKLRGKKKKNDEILASLLKTRELVSKEYNKVKDEYKESEV